MAATEGSSPSVALERWLLSDAVQVCGGRFDGAVVSWTDDAGHGAFAYPEITGYFLAWLASVAEAQVEHREHAQQRARRAVAWLDRASGDGLPPTRARLDGAPCTDWRCRGIFSFDVAMIVRGLKLATDLAPPHADALRRRLLERAANAFAVPDAELAPFWSEGPAALPDRWATRADVHLVKAAAALLANGDLPPALERAARGTLRRWSARSPSGDLHPALYHVEGLLLAGLRHDDRALLEQADRCYSTLMRMQAADGTLPAAAGPAGAPVRSDVLAQALRAGCVLREAASTAAASSLALSALRRALEGFVTERGSVLFTRDGERHHNTWATMFAHQALVFHDALCAGRSLSPRLLLGLV